MTHAPAQPPAGDGAGARRRATDPAANPGPVELSGYAGRVSPTRLYPRPLTRDQRTTVVYGILCFILILVVLQLWLLTATMNAFLGGDAGVIWPAALASLGCFGLNAGLLWYLGRMERS